MNISIETALILYQTANTALKNESTLIFRVDYFGVDSAIKINGDDVTVHTLNGNLLDEIISGKTCKESFKLIKGSYKL